MPSSCILQLCVLKHVWHDENPETRTHRRLPPRTKRDDKRKSCVAERMESSTGQGVRVRVRVRMETNGNLRAVPVRQTRVRSCLSK